MKKLWYCLFYGLCTFTLVFSFAWMLSTQTTPPGSAPTESASSAPPNVLAQAPASGVALPQGGYYLCDEGGRLAVYRCGADGKPTQRLELTEIYVNLLPEPDALRIKQGLVVWGDQELASLLEDLGN